MPQIFHRSANTLSRLSIFGGLFFVAARFRVSPTEIRASASAARRARAARAADAASAGATSWRTIAAAPRASSEARAAPMGGAASPPFSLEGVLKSSEHGGYREAVQPEGLALTLKPYQQQALAWMSDMEALPRGINGLFWERRYKAVLKAAGFKEMLGWECLFNMHTQ